MLRIGMHGLIENYRSRNSACECTRAEEKDYHGAFHSGVALSVPPTRENTRFLFTLIAGMASEVRKTRDWHKERTRRAVIKSTKPAAGTPATGLWHKTA